MESFFNEKTTSKAKDIIVKGAIKTVAGSAVAAVYELGALLFERAREIKNNEVEEKVRVFHEKLALKDLHIDTNSEENFFKNYVKVLETYIKDDEADKYMYYVNLLDYISLKEPKKEERLYLFSTIRDLSSFDILNLRKIFILSHYRIRGEHRFKSPLVEHSIGKLVKLGIIKSENNTAMEISSLGEMVFNAVFDKSLLTPASVGLDTYKDNTFSFVFFTDLSNNAIKHDVIFESFSNVIKEEGFEVFSPSYLNSVVKTLDKQPLLYRGSYLVLIYDKEFSPVVMLERLKRRKLVKIYLRIDETRDPLADLTGGDIHSYETILDVESFKRTADLIKGNLLSSLA